MKILRPLIPLTVILILYFALKEGVPYLGSQLHEGTWPVIPTSVMKMYVFFIAVGVLLIFTFTDDGFKANIGPFAEIYLNPDRKIIRFVSAVLVGCFGAWVSYQYVKPTFDAPVELRSIHPAPPSNAKMWGKTYSIGTLKNPLREDKENFAANVKAGGEVYYKNCFYCHGDRMLGKGPFWDGFTPVPANFVDIGTIAQLSESFVFWRIGTGGPGLPSEATPWLSAMPVWHEFLSEEEVWKVILFLYDYTGHSPRVIEPHH